MPAEARDVDPAALGRGDQELTRTRFELASATQTAGKLFVTVPFSWTFTSGTRTYYALSSTNPYQSGSVAVTAGYIPAAPSGVTATAASASSVAVKWNAVTGATRYKVRYVNTNAQTGDLTSLSYTWPGLAAGMSHCFVVLACGDPNFCSSPSMQSCAKTAADQYKVGVVLYRNGMSISDISLVLDKFRSEVALNRPVRTGNGREMRAVVELDVPWSETERSRGAYDFQWYKDFARLCEAKGIKWTPLLSAHYVPSWALASYEPHRLRNMQGQIVSDDQNAFLKFSPSSWVWGTEIRAWIRAFVDAMAYDGAYNHFSSNGAIDELLAGNEVQYPSATLTSNDAASQQRWHDLQGTKPFPATFTAAFQAFRADELSYAITAMVKAASDRLREIGMSQTGVTSKLYPFYFPRSTDTEPDRWRGYTSSSLSFMNSNFNSVFALDSYANSFCGKSWSPASDFSAARSRTSLPLYIAEFNRNKVDCKSPLTRSQVSTSATSAFQTYGARTFVFFAWNPTGKDADLAITADQKAGLTDAMSWVVP